MLYSSWLLPVRRAAYLGAAMLIAACTANAQLTSMNASHDPALSSSESSSNDYLAVTDSTSTDPGTPAAPAAGGGRQYDNRSGGRGGNFSHLAFEAGGGFNAPIGNDTPYITWGGNFTIGGGYRFNRWFSTLLEYQFIDDKLPGAFVAAGGGTGGNTHIQSITLDPVIDLFPKSSNNIYVTGGGGWYHKSTNFTVQVCCDFFGYPVTLNANSFSSDQGGVNFGLGYSHRLGGVYGDGTMKLFAEARYLWVNTPPITETNGLGRTELIPVTFGVRW
jgi:Outer membrane protein beta-barrel domain